MLSIECQIGKTTLENSSVSSDTSQSKMEGGFSRKKSIPARSASRDDLSPGVTFRVENGGLPTNLSFSGRESHESLNQWCDEMVPVRMGGDLNFDACSVTGGMRPRSYSLADTRLIQNSPSSFTNIYGIHNRGNLDEHSENKYSTGSLKTIDRCITHSIGPGELVRGEFDCGHSFEVANRRRRSIVDISSEIETRNRYLNSQGNQKSGVFTDSQSSPLQSSMRRPGSSFSRIVTHTYHQQRRPSIGGNFSGVASYSGSLSHLVPNAHLQTHSRRISTHGSASGCFCASCGSTVTPYWRDGWAPEVMLCNACGLRFQKFARRCPSCMYIPRKEDSLGDNCIKCFTPWIVGP